MNKIAEGIFGRLSDILRSSADDLKDFSAVETTQEDCEVTQKRQVLRRITVLVDGDAAKIKESISRRDFKVVSDDMLKEVNEMFTSIIRNEKPKSKVKKPVKNQKVTIRKPKASLRDTSGKFLSLVTLRELLNKGLAEQIQSNMGKGNARSILNYRSGRFAKSATVKELTRTRDGAVTAFYTYMKYPYKTFEPGYAQGIPLTRDPKLLISKSIRQLAIELTINKFKVESR